MVIESFRKRIPIRDSNHAIQWLPVDQAVERDRSLKTEGAP
jgi:hypothetical protein